MKNNVNNSNNLNKSNSVSASDEKKQQKKTLSREVVNYLIFGVLTTVVGWAVYFAIMLGGRALLSIPNDDTTSGAYIGLYTAAQLIQWVCAVLFAFFTNRKWVFTEADKSKKILPQLLAFSGGRVITLGLDYVITLVGAMALSALLPALNSVSIIGITLNFNEVAAKVAAAFVVIVCNYIFSKLFVFKKGSKS